MTAIWKEILVAIAAGVFAVGAYAGQAAAASLDGTTYAEIAPTFNGSDGNQSFIRLGNGGAATTTYTITVVGSPSGATYGTGTIQVPPAASPQYPLSQILSAANARPLANGDTSYSLYLQDSDPSLSYQHVIYNGANGFFENVSICKYAATANYTGLNAKLANVHTSLLANYPAEIYVHNYSASTATYNVSVYDNNTGTLIGTVPITVGANSTYIQPFTWFEQQLNWTPSSTQQHANMLFQATGGATYEAEVGDYIYNQPLAAYVNMTQRCGFSTPSTTTTTYEGSIAGTESGTLTVTVQANVSSESALISATQSSVEKAQAVSTASGTLLITVANPVALTGTYNSSTNAINLSGGGYSFSGTISSGIYSGTYTGPNSSSGAFSAVTGTQGSVTAYCGTYTSNNGSAGVYSTEVSVSGAFSSAANPTNGIGQSATSSGQITVTGSAYTETGLVFPAEGGSDPFTGTGTIQNGTVSGTFASTAATGSFTGSACPLPSS